MDDKLFDGKGDENRMFMNVKGFKCKEGGCVNWGEADYSSSRRRRRSTKEEAMQK